ncbi:glycoside hydrolase family 3 N-terminal domain-containing protein [Sinosporangium siamense]|uniref:beta-N-acetylhexosaminidase n=1 Tax=Sinosporangium siamense TaxID=1367973 RepID=A0A919VAL1_9ACTN|nr:glycoside hydrolase family 3 N-terminal domain-containing protein [Sinosporangium siamense]GII95537.1 hypothetical protein Ssi02_57680 [Sinosporangium siamense]
MSASAAARYHAAVRAEAAAAGVRAPLISGNLESGIGYSLGRIGTELPYPAGIGLTGDVDVAYRTALQAAREARAVGYDWTFSPTVDVRTTESDPILGVRAFGVDSAKTSELGSAQVRGFRDGGIISCAKHFPGHGDSVIDSHLGLPVIDRTRGELDEIHVPPFGDAIAAGVESIMVGHVVLPALGVDEPASVSAKVNREWLRERLQFDGVIITDSLRMAAISDRWSPEEAAVLALAAGADVVNAKCEADLLPSLVAAVRAAVDDGRLSIAEIDRSVERLTGLRRTIAGHGEPALDPKALDLPSRWDDPSRAFTVDAAGAVASTRDLVVIGESVLAKRIADAASARGIAVTLAARTASAEAVRELRREGETVLLPVVVPETSVSARDHATIAEIVAESEAGGVVALVVNGMMRAVTIANERVGVIVAPAVDAFGICSEAAVDAILDRVSAA